MPGQNPGILGWKLHIPVCYGQTLSHVSSLNLLVINHIYPRFSASKLGAEGFGVVGRGDAEDRARDQGRPAKNRGDGEPTTKEEEQEQVPRGGGQARIQGN